VLIQRLSCQPTLKQRGLPGFIKRAKTDRQRTVVRYATARAVEKINTRFESGQETIQRGDRPLGFLRQSGDKRQEASGQVSNSSSGRNVGKTRGENRFCCQQPMVFQIVERPVGRAQRFHV
jgi:hypothetical protein